MSKEIETMIVGSLIHNQDFCKKVLPFVKDSLFDDESTKPLVNIVLAFYEKYKTVPTKDAVVIELENYKGLTENAFQNSKDLCSIIFSQKFVDGLIKQNSEWVLDKTEKYFKDRACFNAIMEAMGIIDGENKKLTRDAIPDILKNALNISFDVEIGHDYLEDAEERFEFYHRSTSTIPFALNELNRLCGGKGVPRKSLVIPIAPTGVGKSMFMTDWAAYLLKDGYNVLYVTLELSEERISERIDAKLFDTTVGDLKEMPKTSFINKIESIKKKSTGKIITKEYSPGSFHANHLRFLLQECKNKKNFKPDVIMIDYLNLMASYRMKDNSNSYSYVKAITEEIRGVAMEYDAVVCAPTQTNRSGVGVTDYGLTEVSDSYGAAMTADIIFGFISTPDLEALNQMRAKIMKNRFGLNDISFIFGVNRAKMTFYNLEIPEGSPLSTNKTITKLDDTNQKELKF